MTFFPNLLAFSIRTLLRASALGLLILWLVNASPAWADPPARAARIAEVAGTAWLFEPDTKAWNRVLRNQTVGQGDQLRTAGGSRVTLRTGSSTVWLDENTELNVLQMDDSAVLLRLLKGDLALRLRTEESADETRVQTREGVTSPEMAGLIRVGQSERATRVVVEEGRAQFNSDPAAAVQRAWLREGEQGEFVWAGSPRVDRMSVYRDAFHDWFATRDQAEERMALLDESYVSPEMTGAEELNQHGEWEVAEEYGNVWIPTRVAPGWEPYRDGRWVWTRQWGWSWVDNAPWGFAPFHYGRWVQYRNRWAWAPGRFERRPAYAPALVTWPGGPQVRIEIGGGRRTPPTQWAPLPPRQAYVPNHDHSPQYGERFRWDRNAPGQTRDDLRTKPRPTQPWVQPQPHRQPMPQPATQTEQQNWRGPMVPQTTNREREDREERDGRDGKRNRNDRNDRNDRGDRNDRNRETQQQTPPIMVQPNNTPSQATTPPARFEVPLFTRDGAGSPPTQPAQRPAQPTQKPATVAPTPVFTPPAVAAPAPQRQRPPANADEDESAKVRNNKMRDRQERERQERELR